MTPCEHAKAFKLMIGEADVRIASVMSKKHLANSGDLRPQKPKAGVNAGVKVHSKVLIRGKRAYDNSTPLTYNKRVG